MKKFFLNELNMLFAIVLNSIIISLLYFPQIGSYIHHKLEYLDHIFILIFLVEALVKLSVYKPKNYFASGWNIFDFILVVGSLPVLINYIYPIPNTAVLLILRLLRLVRLARFLNFIPRIEMIIAGLGRALKSSVFVIIVLIFLNFLLALFTCHFYGKIAPEYFGDPLISSYTIFQLFTVEGWNEVAHVVSQKYASPITIGLARFSFVLIVLTGGIFGMSLANAIFVDEMTMDNNQDLEAKMEQLGEQLAEIKEMLTKR
ncbi:MAG: ion transporter [Saprospiraceae bacterium]